MKIKKVLLFSFIAYSFVISGEVKKKSLPTNRTHGGTHYHHFEFEEGCFPEGSGGNCELFVLGFPSQGTGGRTYDNSESDWYKCREECFKRGKLTCGSSRAYGGRGESYFACSCCNPPEPSYVAHYGSGGDCRAQCSQRGAEGTEGKTAHSEFGENCFCGIKKEAWCDAKNNNKNLDDRKVRGERMAVWGGVSDEGGCGDFCKAHGGVMRRHENNGGLCYCSMPTGQKYCEQAILQFGANQQANAQQNASKAK